MSQEQESTGDGPYMERCLSFTISGTWGHFRRPEGTVQKRTFRIIPRTTVAGLLAAIVGVGRDQYYDTFKESVSGIAIKPESKLRTMNVPQKLLATTSDDFHKSNGVKLPDPSSPRQRHSVEFVVNPAYRIDVTLEDDDFYTELKTHLENGTATYTPSLGLSECLASITYHGEREISAGESVTEVDSLVVDSAKSIRPEQAREYRTEHSPAFMESLGSGSRRTTDTASLTYTTDTDSIQAAGVQANSLSDGRTVMFF